MDSRRRTLVASGGGWMQKYDSLCTCFFYQVNASLLIFHINRLMSNYAKRDMSSYV